jgi:hypothetical protein
LAGAAAGSGAPRQCGQLLAQRQVLEGNCAVAATHQSDGSKKYDKCREHPSILWRIRSVDQASTAGDRVMANDRMNFRGFELSDADRALVRSSDEHGLSHLENKIRKARLYTRPLTSVRAEIDGCARQKTNSSKRMRSTVSDPRFWRGISWSGVAFTTMAELPISILTRPRLSYLLIANRQIFSCSPLITASGLGMRCSSQ